MIQISTIELRTDNQQRVSTTVFQPKKDIHGSVVIAPALAVDQAHYHAFALWLANQGFMVTTFDYSAMGALTTASYKHSNATISDWAKFDCKAILEHVASTANNKPIYWLGHSLGGQIVAMIPNAQLISKVITIASGSGYWRENATELKKKVWFLWYFVAPVLLQVLGYFPGKRIGMVGNLPYGVMSQWRKWCLHPEYLLGVESSDVQRSYQQFNKPITAFSFTDDQLLSEKNIVSLHSFFGQSKTKMQRISPEQLRVNSIGHFGFFKETLKEPFWESHLLAEFSLS